MQWIKSNKNFLKALKENDLKALASYVKNPRDAQHWLSICPDPEYKQPALHMVINSYLPEAAKLFIATGVNLDAKNSSGRTPLHLAIENDLGSVVEALVCAGADVNLPSGNYTPLMQACLRKQDYLAELLIKAGAIVDAQHSNTTALILASKNSPLSVVKLLVESGANVNVAMNGMTPLYAAILGKNNDTVDYLISKNANPHEWTYINQAITSRNYGLYQKLVDAGADIVRLERSGCDVMHVAAQKGFVPVLEHALSLGLDINKKNSSSQTPLFHAIEQKDLATVKFLVRNGAELNIEDGSGYTAIEKAKKEFPEGYGFLVNEEKLDGQHLVIDKKETLPQEETSLNEKWHLLSDSKIAHYGVYPEIEKKLTEIFNFATQEQIVIIDDLSTKMQNVLPVKNFAEVSEAAIEKAYEAYKAAGGKIGQPDMLAAKQNRHGTFPVFKGQ